MGAAISIQMLTVPQVAEALQVKVRTVYGYIRQGRLKAARLPGSDLRIRQSDFTAFIDGLFAANGNEDDADEDQGDVQGQPGLLPPPGATGDLFQPGVAAE